MDVATIIGIAGLLIAWLTYKKTFPKKSKEEVEREDEQVALLAHFKATQRLAKEVREGLTNHATINDLWDAYLFLGITYRVGIRTMTESHEKCLSDELYNGLLAEKYTIPQIRLLHDDLNTQYKALTEMKNQLLVYQTIQRS